MIEDILRLKAAGHTFAQIAAQLGTSKGVVRGLYQRHRHRPDLAELTAPPGNGYQRPARQPAAVHPAGWEPGFKLEQGKGQISSGPLGEGQVPDWGFVMEELKLDPSLYEVVEPINVRSWDAAIGDGEVRRMWYYKANVILRRDASARADIEALQEEIRTHVATAAAPPGDHSFVAVLTDWQLGKSTNEAVDRILAGAESIVERIAELRAVGRRIDSVYLADLGDLMEGVDGQYQMQTFEVDLDRRSQQTLARRLLLHVIKTVAPHANRVVIPVTPSNHGENRKNGKAFTSFADNDDVALAEQVAEILQENPAAYGHVDFVIAKDDLDLTLDVSGTVTTFAHGHQMKNGIEAWWKGQSLGRQPAMDATLLITGHRHHLEVTDFGSRTAITAPALESDSPWFRNVTGASGRPGLLTLLVGGGHWSDLQVLA